MAIHLFAKIGDIKGESQDDRHQDEIEVLTWSWGVSHDAPPAGGGGGASGRPTFADFTIAHSVDKASPLLMKACATGEHLKDATVAARKAGTGQQDYLIIKMTDVIITGVAPSGGREDTATLETVSMRFAKVDFEYKAQKPDGSLETGVHSTYDIKANREA